MRMGRDKDDNWSLGVLTVPTGTRTTFQEWLKAEVQEARNPAGSPGAKEARAKEPLRPAKEAWRTPATCSMQRGRVASASVESFLDCKTQTNVNLRLKRMSSRSRVRVVEGWGLEASSACYMSSQLSFSNFKSVLGTV